MQHLSQESVARAAGVTYQAVTAFERGIPSLSADSLRKMLVILNMNPDFLDNPSLNPFASKELIQMEFPEVLLLPGLDFQLIYYLAEKNSSLQVIYLYSNTLFAKKILRGTMAANPIVAIACRDTDGNTFLFKRRKIMAGPVVGADELRIELDKYRSVNKDITITDKEVGDPLLHKIKDGAITKDELAPLFDNRMRIVPDEEEEKILLKKRENNIPADDILRLFDKYLIRKSQSND